MSLLILPVDKTKQPIKTAVKKDASLVSLQYNPAFEGLSQKPITKVNGGFQSKATPYGLATYVNGESKTTYTTLNNLTDSLLGDFSIEMLIRSDYLVSLGAIVGCGAYDGSSNGSGNGANRAIIFYNNHYYFWGNSSDWDSGVTPTLGKIEHVVLTVSGSTIALYVDGVLKATGTKPSLTASSPNRVMVGSGHNAAVSNSYFDLYKTAIYSRALRVGEIASLYRNPWQIFEPNIVPFYFNLSGTPTTIASGSLAAITLTAPTATTVQTSVASGSLAALSLSAPNATATTVSTTIASGSLAAINLSAPNATSVQTSIASGSLASVSLTAPTATVSTVSATTASGSLAAITLTAPTATTVQTSVASGDLAALSLTAPTATVSTVASVIASGNIVAININATAAQAVLSVKGIGYFSPMTLIAPNHVLAPSTTVPEIVNFDTMIQREVSFDTLITRTVSYTVER